MARLYFEEPDEAVWHIIRRREGRYVAACGRAVAERRGRVWPVHAGETTGPDADRVCPSCRAST